MRNFGDFLERPVSALAGPVIDAELKAADMIPRGSLFGPYWVIRELGRGGMGVVCLAERGDGGAPERVALKILLQRLALETLDRRRFDEEREILASLDHPGIARLIDGGVDPDGTPWFAMEYVDGVSIDRYCTDHAPDVPALLELFARVCDAVDHAHRQSVVHRDIKPSNILVAADGTVKLLDFGIARLAAPDGPLGPHDRTLTHRGSQRLTPAYASPEQLRGDPVTTASDVYALGVLLYRLLTGKVPARRAADVVRQKTPGPRQHPPSLGPNLPSALDAITGLALRSEVEGRFQSAGELAARVREYLAGG